ncbi:DNA cytosine methyltransferase [Candidatus Mycoplasma haematohominis]|uniref:Cytosine-specific methyltransferase n=1 Tax=Candidatus Mycoplasma haematohominis TaxID=1494318 RepID=A0A478FQY6_9MOLU|nr:DNA cytosine methyltransferase [Candidatus Mycoplasma haemohominis]GCE63384.1 modification methylase HaeIII [Candidatus Mycoplasma haemohominis]
MNKEKPKSIELFAGAGGLALGLEKSGFFHIALNEIDKYAVQTLRVNREKWRVFEEDIRELVDKNVCQLLGIKEKELDLLSGGFPCQTFSYAGKKDGLEDSRGQMFYYFALMLKQLKPKLFLCENVKGLVTHDSGKTFKRILDTFSEIGYRVSYKVLNALDYGVSQKRERVFIVGIRNDLYKKDFVFPEKFLSKNSIRDALKDVPLSIGAKYSEKRSKLFKLIPAGGCWVDLPVELAKEYMGKSYYSGGGKRGVLRRISWDEPCLTLTCSPVQKQTDRCHPEEERPFTVREYARIQSFPDDWKFVGSIHSQYKQIGNAVPVNLAFAIGRALMDYWKEICS